LPRSGIHSDDSIDLVNNNGVGTMDDNFGYGAPFDGLNVFELDVRWKPQTVDASFTLAAQLPVASFNSVMTCNPGSANRSCIPEPGVASNRWLDSLSRRQRPTVEVRLPATQPSMADASEAVA
jgi:hypothetical protein